jgi:UDP-N-acetylmuramyl pentapeptide phosphotransferase/UDP-N-acetylglucosamine-1-phosphate transferase
VTIWRLAVGAALGAVLAWAVYRPVVRLLKEAGALRPNYAGRPIPVGGGMVFVLAALAAQTVQLLLWPLRPGHRSLPASLFVCAVTLLGFALLGLLDDLLGTRETGGFRGHFRLLRREGRLTSGTLKALGGAVVAAWPAWVAAWAAVQTAWSPPWLVMGVAAVNLLLIALTANAVNLLDLRPGRAFKGFLLLFLVALAVRPGHPVWDWIAPLAGAAALFAVPDLRGEVMMGDAGSNPLGALVGVGVAWSWPLGLKLAWLAALVAFHLYTERASLSVAIERVAVLRWLDRLGRPAGPTGGAGEAPGRNGSR